MNTEAKHYSATVRNKWITADCTSVDDFIQVYEEMADMMKRWKALGIELNTESNIGDDYAMFYTNDKHVAEAEGFQVEDEDEEEL